MNEKGSEQHLGLVVSRTMKEDGVEEHCVSLLHGQQSLGDVIIAPHSMVHLVHSILTQGTLLSDLNLHTLLSSG